jgi:O-acetylhomoserine (thiol)-lyase
MTEPSVGYHGVRFYETFGDFGYTMRARMEIMRTFGPAMAPLAAWQLMQGLETLPVRMDRHCANTLAVAKFLQDHPQVAWVNYPGLPDNPYHALAKKYLPKGASGLLNFGVKGGGRCAAGRREVHRRGDLHEPPGQHRRRQDPDHPSRPRPPTGRCRTRSSSRPA